MVYSVFEVFEVFEVLDQYYDKLWFWINQISHQIMNNV